MVVIAANLAIHVSV